MFASGPAVAGSTRQKRAERQKAFARREVCEMRRERALLLGKALCWAISSAVVAGLFGWGVGSVLDPISGAISPGWSPPAASVRLLLGISCGALGGATIGLFYHSVFEEERDVPVLVLGVMTLFVLIAGIRGAGHGGVLSTLAGLAVGIPAGLCSGMVVSLVYLVLRWSYLWLRDEIRGY